MVGFLNCLVIQCLLRNTEIGWTRWGCPEYYTKMMMVDIAKQVGYSVDALNKMREWVLNIVGSIGIELPNS